jgi:hypothetical protein
MNLHASTAVRRIMAAAAVTCAAAVTPAVALASPSTHAGAADAGAGAAAARRASCTSIGGNFYHVTKGGVSYFLGTPNHLSSGAAALLKPKQNGTTEWTLCSFPSGAALLENRGLALTSRDSSSGGDVTLTPPGNGGDGFASQQWNVSAAGPMFTFANVKTGLYLRVRNGGPSMGQTVTTGSSFTVWFAF